MKPHHRLDDVDVVVTRNSLRKLLDFCSGRVSESFRVNLFLVGKTLFIDRYERNPRWLISGSRDPGYGRSFEKAFTEYPSGLEHSIGHHRVMQYSLGELNCMVQFEVDACYPGDQANDLADLNIDLDLLTPLMDRLSISELVEENATKITVEETDRQPMSQSMAAELKLRNKRHSNGADMPQLWFGRTPWLIVGYHTKGTVNKVNTINAATRFANWETENQTELCKLATVLSRLREGVMKNKGMNCSAICQKHSSPPLLKIYSSESQIPVLPAGFMERFWASKNT